MALPNSCIRYYVGNEVKRLISKRVFQENKARQIFQKTNISKPLIRTRTMKSGPASFLEISVYFFWSSTKRVGHFPCKHNPTG